MRQITTICLKGKTIPCFLAVRLRKTYEWMRTCTASTSFTETPSLRTRPRWIIQQAQILQNTTASQKTLLILSSAIGICFMKEREIEVPILVAPQYSRIWHSALVILFVNGNKSRWKGMKRNWVITPLSFKTRWSESIRVYHFNSIQRRMELGIVLWKTLPFTAFIHVYIATPWIHGMNARTASLGQSQTVETGNRTTT